jgi:hypothetical protein
MVCGKRLDKPVLRAQSQIREKLWQQIWNLIKDKRLLIMRTPKVILGFVFAVVLLSGLAFLAFALFSSRYLRFMHKDNTYYSAIAHACDSILLEHPVTSNDVVRFSSHIVVPFRMRISGNDSSLPNIIRQLHPDFVLIGSNYISLTIPPERMGGFGVSWKQDEMRSNYWILESDGDGLVKTLYEEYKQ